MKKYRSMDVLLELLLELLLVLLLLPVCTEYLIM